jgi:hypothetical protein
MIRPLRQRHRVIVCSLGVLLPVAFAAGVAARKPVPVAANVRLELAGQRNDFGSVVWTKADIWPRQHIITSLRRDAANSLAVELILGDLAKPDVLVYWAAGKEAAVDSLPDTARLLGNLLNRSPLPLPPNVRGEAGRLILYSLADHEVVAASKSFVVEKD